MKRFLLLIIFVISCSEPGPHADNMKYIYKVTYTNSEFTDRLTLERSSVSGFVSTIVWDSEIRQDKGSSTGVSVESKSTNSNLSFELPQPLGEYLNLTNLLPAPRVEFPLSIGDSIYMSHRIDYKHSTYNGKSVEGYIKVSGKEFYSNQIVNDTCWVISSNLFSTTDTSATYYYNTRLGFVYFEYLLGTDTIEVSLDSLTTSG